VNLSLLEQDEISLEVAGRRIPIVRVENKASGRYIFFLITKGGLHYSIHPSGNPHLKNNSGNLAELDLDDLKKITIEDFQTLFKYPNHNRDVLVFPIPKSFGAWVGDSFDIPRFLSGLFQARSIYILKAGNLPGFFQAKPGNYLIIDPRKDRVMMQFEGNPLGPLNFPLGEGPSNYRMKNMFSINLGIEKALRKLPDSQLGDFEPDELTISQMVAQVKAILDQVQVIRWREGGQELSRGPMVRYFRMRRLDFD